MTQQRRTSRRGLRPTGPTRKFLWGGVIIGVNGLTNTGGVVETVIDTVADLHLVGSTLVRIHGDYGVRAAATGNLANAARVSVGMIVVSADARSVGLSAMPNPDQDVSAPWLWHQDLVLQGDGTNDLAQARIIKVDSRSMRKLQGNQVVAFVIQNEANVTIDATVVFRFLVKLP